ncbi:MAG: orotidine-5'-phosphate decarboxylase [Thiobacillus sp.]|jgi:orotidine-5'-phosphate decarboxylase|uniref:orotidine-5'-phosphate decarboxylase n=1 Tax=Thiobacillus sp. TaxID=924 RepID=UPI002893BF3F|nr:orotidine-5'-phosphate decarboxylase [Thiobacillus sp.]MDT3707527.1 orotidine-5'-phosphate decarboxylase [Thiobacillus sp.]
MRAAKIIVALDYADAASALALVERLDPVLCRLKVGKELFTAAGPELVRTLVARGFEVFLDLKFHDIPNTVAAACRTAAGLGVWMLNVHASGGRRMMEAAHEALADLPKPPHLIAVTVLTSMSAEDLGEIGIVGAPADQVLRLARLAHACKLDGVVCSAQEAAMLRAELGTGFRLVTPGIRPVGVDTGDQRRVMTPSEALRVGATDLVIGRPITAAADPLAALKAIQTGIQNI